MYVCMSIYVYICVCTLCYICVTYAEIISGCLMWKIKTGYLSGAASLKSWSEPGTHQQKKSDFSSVPRKKKTHGITCCSGVRDTSVHSFLEINKRSHLKRSKEPSCKMVTGGTMGWLKVPLICIYIYICVCLFVHLYVYIQTCCCTSWNMAMCISNVSQGTSSQPSGPSGHAPPHQWTRCSPEKTADMVPEQW